MGEEASQRGSPTWSSKTQEFKMSRVYKVPILISKYWATQFKTNIKSFITSVVGPLFQSYIVEIIRN